YRRAAIFLLVLVPLLIYPILTVRLSLVVWLTAVGFILFLSAALLQWQLWLPPAAALLSVIMAFPVWAWSRLKTSSRRVDEVVQNRSAAMDAIDHGVIILDKELRIEHMNSLAEHITNFMLSDVINLSLNTVLPGMDINNKPKLLEAYQLEDRDGKHNKVYVHINPFSDRWGSSRGFVLNLSLEPLSLSNKAENEKESHYDELTGLYDRTYISRLIAQAIKEGTVSNELYILNIDIDNLALVGDTRMHKSTNRILQVFVQRVQSVTGKSNTPGRLASDQLVLLIDDSDMTKVEKIAAEIINQAKVPITIDTGQVILSINIGISHYPTDGKNAKTLLKHASFAIRQNESTARTRYKFYSRKDHEISMLDHGIEQGLRKSLNEDSLSLSYQPQISLKTGELVGFEALLRWINEDGIYVSTDQAITIAEKSDLINQIGQWVINTGCQQMQRWQQSGIPAVRLSINLSPKDLEQTNFLDDTKAIIHLHGIDPSFLEFEITEHSVLKQTDLSVNILNSFKAMGASIAIDDFGTGYSSFNYLKALPISTVKIDKSFVEDMVDIKDDAFIVLSMISMSHGLGINVIAEGVETPEQARILKQHGCDVIQGYLVSRPIPASDIASWLDEECHHEKGKYYFQACSTWAKIVPEY
ncbi:MAG: EAL domain-containing protein, partial [Gammaproteobacteria bacterium]|nr:EAL domain-containing protein [Gammaproteobacteria bacterium]